jgi:hypothetical protein
MSLLIASLCALLAYVVLDNWLLPLTERRTFQSKFAEMTKVGWMAALAFTRRFALLAAATFGGLWLLISLMGWLSNAMPSMAWMHESFLAVLIGLNSFLGSIAIGKVVVFFLLLSVILLVMTVRNAKSQARQEYQSLQQEAANGQLPPLDPSDEMLQATKKMEYARSEYYRVLHLPEDEMGAREKQEKQSFLDLLRQIIPAMENHIKDLDIRRRILPALAAKTPPPPTNGNSWWSRFFTFFTSQGMVYTISRTSGAIARVGLVLLMVSFTAANKSMITDLSDGLSKRIASLQLQNKSRELNAEWGKSLLINAPAATQVDDQWDEQDEEALDGIAREFELAISDMLGEGAEATPRAVAFQVKVNAIRENIIKAYAYRPDGSMREGFNVAEQGARMADASPEGRAAKEFSQKYAREGVGREPKTEAGKRYKEKLRQQVKNSPHGKTAWQTMKGKYAAAKASFSTAATPRQVVGMMFDQVLTGITDIPGESFADDIASRAVKKAGGKTFKYWAEYKMDKFTADLAGKASFQEAAANAASKTCTAEQFVQYAVNDIDFPRIEDLDNRMKEYRPSLEHDDLGAKRPQAKAAVEKYARATSAENTRVFAEAVSDYKYHFPGQSGAQAESIAAEVAGEVFNKPRSSGGGGSISKPYAKSSVPSARARNFGALRGFRRIGGVLIGREASNPNVQVDFRNISWKPKGDDRLEILMHRADGTTISAGSYEKDVVHQALAYVADGRLVTATMISAKPMPYFKILVHPTLVNTDLGCRAINVDRLVDKYAREDKRVARVLEAFQYQSFLYKYAALKMATNRVPSYDLGQIGLILTQFEAEVEEHWPDIYERLEGGTILSDRNRSHIAAKPNYYNSEVVRQLTSCMKNSDGSYRAFHSLLSQKNVEVERIEDILKVETEEWSGVREMPYSVDAELSFLHPTAGQNANLFPMDFIRQIVYVPTSFSDEDDGADEAVDENPWEFPNLQRTHVIEELVWKGITSDAADRRVFERMRDFTKLQRLFRVAVSGQLGYDFPVEKLHDLALSTRNAVKEIETPTWNYNPLADLMINLRAQSEEGKKAYQELSKALGTSAPKNQDPCK